MIPFPKFLVLLFLFLGFSLKGSISFIREWLPPNGHRQLIRPLQSRFLFISVREQLFPVSESELNDIVDAHRVMFLEIQSGDLSKK